VSTILALSYLFPDISAPDDFALNEQGALLYWRRPEPQPTPAQIAAAALPAAKAAKKQQIKAATRAHILARYPEWMQANLTARAVELVSLGQITGPEWGQMQAIWNWIKATRARSDLLESDVDNCTTVEAVEQLAIGGWPE
jgi:hypothetical protein